MTERRAETLHELAEGLRTLAVTPVSNRAELDAWYAAAKRLQDWMSAHAPELSGAVPHFVWHYLADADIRLKDSLYEVDQTRQLMEIVQALERGEIPNGAS
jgi:hypothetical protein